MAFSIEDMVMNFTIVPQVVGHKTFLRDKFHHRWIQHWGHSLKFHPLELVQGVNQLSIWMHINLLFELALRDETLKGWPPGCIYLCWNLPFKMVSWPAIRDAMMKFTAVTSMEIAILKDDFINKHANFITGLKEAQPHLQLDKLRTRDLKTWT